MASDLKGNGNSARENDSRVAVLVDCDNTAPDILEYALCANRPCGDFGDAPAWLALKNRCPLRMRFRVWLGRHGAANHHRVDGRPNLAALVMSHREAPQESRPVTGPDRMGAIHWRRPT